MIFYRTFLFSNIVHFIYFPTQQPSVRFFFICLRIFQPLITSFPATRKLRFIEVSQSPLLETFQILQMIYSDVQLENQNTLIINTVLFYFFG